MLDYIEKDKYNELRDFIKKSHQLDLDNYCESFIMRKIGAFFKALRILSVDDFIQRSLQFPDFFNSFLGSLNVEESEMLRDPGMWNILMNELLPDLLKRKEEVRIYLPDFTTGEELLSLLILLKEYDYTLNAEIVVSTRNSNYIQEFRKLTYSIKKVHLAVNNAKSIDHMQGLNLYFDEKKTCAVFNSAILNKARVSYLELNLLTDELPQKVDIILFRNKFLYCNVSCISRIVNKFSASMNNYGFLITGAKDMLIRSNHFNIINKEERIYQRNES